MNVVAAPSPNFEARSRPPDMILLHYTGMKTGAAALARLRDPAAKVSAHWLIEEDGRVFTLVDEAARAWHAGVAFWGGERDINGVSIGVEIVNPGHEFGYRDFPDAQINSVIALLDEIRGRWPVADRRILGHSDVAPKRKQDPGERFPWARLAQSGHGLWPQSPWYSPREMIGLQTSLAEIGYEAAASGALDETTAAIVRAFQRHWLPSRVDGLLGPETSAMIEAVRRATMDPL